MLTDQEKSNLRWSRLEALKLPGSYGWIQWKGTNVCADLNCQCGYMGHIDQDFAYHYRCPNCKQFYDLSGYFQMVPVSEDELTARDLKGQCVTQDVSQDFHIEVSDEQPQETTVVLNQSS